MCITGADSVSQNTQICDKNHKNAKILARLEIPGGPFCFEFSFFIKRERLVTVGFGLLKLQGQAKPGWILPALVWTICFPTAP